MINGPLSLSEKKKRNPGLPFLALLQQTPDLNAVPFTHFSLLWLPQGSRDGAFLFLFLFLFFFFFCFFFFIPFFFFFFSVCVWVGGGRVSLRCVLILIQFGPKRSRGWYETCILAFHGNMLCWEGLPNRTSGWLFFMVLHVGREGVGGSRLLVAGCLV